MLTNDSGALIEVPTGWYALAATAELKPGAVETHRFAGRDIVVFRTQSGRAAALEAYCPHMGAHLGKGGKIEGEHLRCPMHGFEWTAEGRCARTPYGSLPKATAEPLHVRERNGLVLVWHDASGAGPSWEVPSVQTDGWTTLGLTRYDLQSHPQETSENSVDLGHFNAVHGYTDVEIVEPLRTEGPRLFIAYSAVRHFRGTGLSFRFIYRVQVHGLGYSFVEVEAPGLKVRTRHYVLSTPSDPGSVTLRIGAALPRYRGVGRLLRPFVQNRYEHDVVQDFEIWVHKRYQHPPALAVGDGPVGAYRRWARQFYPSMTLSLAESPSARLGG